MNMRNIYLLARKKVVWVQIISQIIARALVFGLASIWQEVWKTIFIQTNSRLSLVRQESSWESYGNSPATD